MYLLIRVSQVRDLYDLPRLEDFLCRGVIERMNKDVTQVKEDFFSVLGLYKDINGLESKKEAETTGIRKLTREKAILYSQIKELEKKKESLLGEMDNSITSISQKFKTIGEEATLQLQQQVCSIREQFDSLLVDATKTGQAIGEMGQMVKKEEDSEKILSNFIGEMRGR